MTSFRSVDLTGGNKKSNKKTKFHNCITGSLEVGETNSGPKDWKNVIYIGYDNMYGDVFTAYDDDPHEFTIFFGEAGDEFKDNGE